MKQLTESMFQYLEGRIKVKMKLKEIILPKKKNNLSSDEEKTICVFQDGKRLAFDRVILYLGKLQLARVLRRHLQL